VGWWIALDVILFVAAIVLLIVGYASLSFHLFMIGLICLIAAVVLLSILVGKASFIETLIDIFD
jgi:hypothetical protein